MLLVVVGHAAIIYTVSRHWVINDPPGARGFDAFVWFLSLFRMQAFFIISGFFSRLMLERGGPGTFLRRRGTRLVIPLVSAALVIIPVQGVILAAAGVVSLGEYYGGPLWVSHLWFILNLIVYTLLVAAAWPLLRRVAPERLPVLGGAVVLALPLTGLAARALTRIGPDYLLPGHALELSSLLYYLPFFAFGFAYMPGKDHARLRRLAGAAAVLFLVGVAGKLLAGGRGLNLYSELAQQWAASLLCLYLGRQLFNRESRAVARLAEASYSIYLFHQPLMIGLGLLLVCVPADPGVKFVAVTAVGFAASLAMHVWLIRPYPWLALLFNGKPLRRAGARPAPLAPAADPHVVRQVAVRRVA